jgi:putative ribosome biogenesis GTPase RsgA
MTPADIERAAQALAQQETTKPRFCGEGEVMTDSKTDELKRLSKEARLGDLEIVSAGTFARPLPSSRLVRVYSRKAGVYLTDVIDRDNAALIVAAVNALPELLERVRRLERALQAIAKEQSATTATEAADRMQFIARAALKETP